MNGVFRVTSPPAEPMPSLDGRQLGGKASLLAALGRELNLPDYYGDNWDALEECLADLSWHDGPLYLLITHAENIPTALREVLTDVFADAARHWATQSRPFALFLQAN